MKIFANHSHIYPDRLAPQWKPNIGTVDNLLKFMDDVGIDKTVAFLHDGGEESFDTVKWYTNRINDTNRLIPFGVINPWKQDACSELKRMYEYGFKGIKMHPCVYKYNVTSEEAYKVYETAQRIGFFIVFHTGVHHYRLKDYQPIIFDQISWDFPELNFSLEHVGGRAFFYEAVAVIQNHSIYNDLSNSKGPEGRIYAGLTDVFRKENAPFYLGSKLVLELRDMIGASYMVFGTDFPHIRAEEAKYAIECIKRLDIEEYEKEAILGKNLKKLLKLI